MKKYESYKDSGVEWIGEIPYHWNKVKIKFLGKVSSGDSLESNLIDKKEGDYPVYGGNGVMGYYSDFNFNKPILVIGRVGEKCGNVHYTDKQVFINDNSLVFEPINENMNLWYIHHSLIQRDLNQLRNKNTQPLITGTIVKDEIIPHPSNFEQHQIVKFLDTKTLLIDSLIEKTQKKIELLKEQRTSLINQVVTKGLNSNVEMKDSGVEWIGEIPSHWELTKFKFKGNVIIGLSYKPENQVNENEGVLVMRSSNVQNGKPSFHDNVYVDCEISDKLRTREGDILICSRNGSRRLIGKNCLITKEIEGMSWGVFMTMYRSPSYKFFYWLLNSPVFKSQSGLFLTSTINQLTVSTLENMVVPYVSDEIEQQQIVEYLDEKTQLIDSTIINEKKRIKLLKEYRQSLISEVVTGKIKVTND